MTRTKLFLQLIMRSGTRTTDALALETGCTKLQARAAIDALVQCRLIEPTGPKGSLGVLTYRLTESGRLRAGLKPLWVEKKRMDSGLTAEEVVCQARQVPNSVFALAVTGGAQ